MTAIGNLSGPDGPALSKVLIPGVLCWMVLAPVAASPVEEEVAPPLACEPASVEKTPGIPASQGSLGETVSTEPVESTPGLEPPQTLLADCFTDCGADGTLSCTNASSCESVDQDCSSGTDGYLVCEGQRTDCPTACDPCATDGFCNFQCGNPYDWDCARLACDEANVCGSTGGTCPPDEICMGEICVCMGSL